MCTYVMRFGRLSAMVMADILQRTASCLPLITRSSQCGCSRTYAVGSKLVAEKEDKSFVDMDAEKLCSYVCINYFTEGEEPGPKILPDSEYPDWLFKLDLSKPKALEDLDPEVDGWIYWRALRQRQIRQALREKKLRFRYLHLQNSPTMKKTGGRSNVTINVDK
ncbi:hypothetical protein AB6A40_000540 [Gnathostoma spinigerum]|uniref:Large ribosomal subunit protein mL54 n=1 Tax=Gnathostoma spinigerum TaxID=75299 RepID=A0ABD6E4C4_9BILA